LRAENGSAREKTAAKYFGLNCLQPYIVSVMGKITLITNGATNSLAKLHHSN